MEDLEDVRRRMQQKKQQQPVLNDRLFQKFYRFAISTMTVFAMVLIASCFIKANPNIDVMTFIDQHILTLLPIPNFLEDAPVSQLINYQEVSENTFVSNDENIYALEDGIIQKVTETEIIVIYQNGVNATYSHFATSQVKAYDRIQSGESIATYEQDFQLHLTKNGQAITYEEVFA